MIQFLEHFDQKLFLLINGWHSPVFDFIMYWISDKYIWIPLYAVLLYAVIKKNVKAWWISILAIALLVLLADQISVKLFKEVFLRYRPCKNLEIQHLVHLVHGHCGGWYGFVSSHAANTFALAGFLSLVFKKQWISAGLLIWAGLVAYSRVYLGVHYPADVTVGAMLGLIIGGLVYLSYRYSVSKFIR